MEVLTPIQQEIVSFIRHFAQSNGYSPTVREVGLALGISSTSTVWDQLQILRAKGAVTWVDMSPRTLKVVGA
ncbi:MAG: heme-binding protein [Alicyclobacillus sp.]|nr:heme-binding protein [Alicyclobacillus sp.]